MTKHDMKEKFQYLALAFISDHLSKDINIFFIKVENSALEIRNGGGFELNSLRVRIWTRVRTLRSTALELGDSVICELKYSTSVFWSRVDTKVKQWRQSFR